MTSTLALIFLLNLNHASLGERLTGKASMLSSDENDTQHNENLLREQHEMQAQIDARGARLTENRLEDHDLLDRKDRSEREDDDDRFILATNQALAKARKTGSSSALIDLKAKSAGDATSDADIVRMDTSRWSKVQLKYAQLKALNIWQEFTNANGFLPSEDQRGFGGWTLAYSSDVTPCKAENRLVYYFLPANCRDPTADENVRFGVPAQSRAMKIIVYPMPSDEKAIVVTQDLGDQQRVREIWRPLPSNCERMICCEE